MEMLVFLSSCLMSVLGVKITLRLVMSELATMLTSSTEVALMPKRMEPSPGMATE